MSKKQSSEPFRKVRKQKNTTSEDFGNEQNVSEKTSEHILTVREVAKLFEKAGVPRTERSVIYWCNKNKQGLTRLDGYFEDNEKKWYITPDSVNQVIGEEKHKQLKLVQNAPSEMFRNPSENRPNASEDFGSEPNNFRSVPNHAENGFKSTQPDNNQTLESKLFNLQAANLAKDMFIEQLKKSNDKLLDDVKQASYQIGQLETQVLQLQAPKEQHNSVVEMQVDEYEKNSEEKIPFEVVQPENSSADLSKPIEDKAERPTPPIYPKTSDQQEDSEQYPQEPGYSNH